MWTVNMHIQWMKMEARSYLRDQSLVGGFAVTGVYFVKHLRHGIFRHLSKGGEALPVQEGVVAIIAKELRGARKG